MTGVSTSDMIGELKSLLENDTDVTGKVNGVYEGRPNYSSYRGLQVWLTSDDPQMTEVRRIGAVDYRKTIIVYITQRNAKYPNSDSQLNAVIEAIYNNVLDNPRLNGLVTDLVDYETQENPLDEELQSRQSVLALTYRVLEKP